MPYRTRTAELLDTSPQDTPITGHRLPAPWVELDLSGHPRAQRIAQAFIEGAMRELGLDRSVAHEAGWAGSELVGNAIRHAAKPHRLRLHEAAGAVIVGVADGLPVSVDIHRYAAPLPELTLEDIDALDANAPEVEHRRGLSAVAQISKGRLGCSIGPGEKTVWFALPTPGRGRMCLKQLERLLAALGSPPALLHHAMTDKPPSSGRLPTAKAVH